MTDLRAIVLPRPVIVGTPSIVPGTNTSATGSPITIPTPSGAVVGETLIACLTAQTSTPTSDVGLPAGWTRIGLPYVAGNTLVRVLGWFMLHLTAAPAASYNFSTPATSTRFGGMMFRVTTADPTQPLVAASAYGTMATGVVTTPAITVPSDNGLMLLAGNAQTTAGQAVTVVAPPSGMTLVGSMIAGLDAGSRTALHVWQQNVDTGTVAAKTHTWTTTAVAQASSNALVLRPGAAVEPTGWPVQVATEAAPVDGEMWVYNGTDLDPATNVVGLPADHQLVTIADMNADPLFMWAHRGGSANWVEFTIRAYTNAVFHGVKYLEVSVHRSSDGEWVMHHDPNTLRMTGVSRDIAATPWSTLATMDQTNSGQPVEKIQRLDDLFETYGQTHVIIIEDKTYANGIPLLDKIESHFPREEAIQRFIIKSTVTSAGPVGPAKARGYKTWGYLYDDQAVNNLPTTNGSFDYFGLNYDATPANWTAALSYGKRVVGFIIANSGNATTAQSKGATGLQVSNVLGVIPALNTLP